MPSPSLPVLDLSRLGGAGHAGFLADLRNAARNVGFFYIVGHGVPAELEGALWHEARAFFALPEAEKLSVEMINSPHFRGYTRAGREITRGAPDWREQFDVHAQRDALPQSPGAAPWTRLQGPNQWPAAQPALRPALLAWQAALTDVAVRLLAAFAEALEQPRDSFEAITRDRPNQAMKIIRYPGRAAGEGGQGVGAHKDSGLLALLVQDAVGGLQVQGEQGWIDATPIPGAFVVNIGELLELASNGYLKATIHRVVSPPGGSDRLSVAFFLGARLDAEVPLLALPPHLAAEATGPTADPLNPLFRNVGENYLKGRLRSHTDVAERYYADLLAGAPA